MDFDLINRLEQVKVWLFNKREQPGETSTEYSKFCTARAIDERTTAYFRYGWRNWVWDHGEQSQTA